MSNAVTASVAATQFVKVLSERKHVLVAELEDLRRDLTELTTRIGVREGQLRNLDELLALEATGADNAPAIAAAPAAIAAGTQNSAGAPFLAAAAETLAKKAKPIHYRELAEMLAGSGVYVPGRDPAANLLSHMSRDSRFRRFERGTYGLQHWEGGKVEAQPTKTRRRRRARKGRGAKS